MGTKNYQNPKSKSRNLCKISFLLFFILFTSFATFAQLKGAGKTITKMYDYRNFDKITFIGFNDNIDVQVGKKFSISVTMKSDNENKLSFTFNESEHQLTIKVKPTTGKTLYDERDTYQIRVTMPETSEISNLGNSDINVSGILGRYFRAKTTSIGSIICQGTIDELDVEKTGDGDVIAEKLFAKSAKIKSGGNGEVIVNVSKEISILNSGAGVVKNLGVAK